MRIEKLHMKNFAPIFVALDKSEVTLDYSDRKDKIINIFIGQMGSCKTFLLGHHQPFATLGNLDVRNAEDLVLEGKQGIKEIVYTRGDDLFEITHVYTPAKNTHTIKSYIKKNGVELNENGNSSSFKVIIETEFGLDQSFLKLFRIGSNVTNLPDMTASERKTFISSMLSDTEVYLHLYKKIGEESRAINAQTTILINKLHMISNQPLSQLEHEAEVEEELCKETQGQIEEATKERYKLEGTINALRNDMSEEAYASYHQNLITQTALIDKEIADKTAELDSIKDYPDPKQVSDSIAACNARISLRMSQKIEYQKKINEDTSERDRLRDQLAVIGSQDHIETLRATYQNLLGTLNSYTEKLKHFAYQGSMGSIISMTSELSNLDSLINDVGQYNADAIKAILRNKRGALHRAEREVAAAQKARDKVQQEMTNIRQVTLYKSTHVMVRPFNCPTPDCPYYKYHPLTEQKAQLHTNVDKVFLEKQNELRHLEAHIYLYEEFPNIARKLDTIKAIWNAIHEEAKDLGVLKEDDLEEIITNLMHRQWYDPSRLQRIKELCGIREQCYELTEKVASMRKSLTDYESSNVEQLKQNLEQAMQRLQENMKAYEALEEANRQDNEELEKLNDAYLKISSMEKTKRELEALENQSKGNHTDLAKIEANLENIASQTSAVADIKMTLHQLNDAYRVHASSLEKLKRKIADIKLTTDQYEDTLKRKQLIQDILDAVSSKKGIPLAYVKLFLVDCKDDLNDLISDVFDDSIEIQDFDIPEDGTEFNIPYTRNGTLIDDINKSSQGERAIISLALSFALIRQRAFTYNIILLDEVDGPLHKSARHKFLMILFKQLQAINAEQVFIVSHNNTFDGYNVNVIKTTDELVDENPLTTVMRV
jgi:DNA repair exonuclease SbcCD ATPase subunit